MKFLILCFMLLAIPSGLIAQDVVAYKCITADGKHFLRSVSEGCPTHSSVSGSFSGTTIHGTPIHGSTSSQRAVQQIELNREQACAYAKERNDAMDEQIRLSSVRQKSSLRGEATKRREDVRKYCP